MPGTSKKTRIIRVRLPNEVMDVIERRVGKDWDTKSQYVQHILIYQLMRSHHRKK